MKKRNAFTLVELLGVIVVLAILSLITIPIISNVINDVRIKSLENSAYGLIEASNLYYAQYGVNSNIRFDIDNNEISSTDTDKLLTYKGSVKEGTVILDKKGQVTVCINDGKNSAYKNYNETKVTTSKGKICIIKENSSIIYLDDEATITQYDNQKLTELVNELKEKVSTLENGNSSLSQQITNLNSSLSETKSSMISLSDVYPVGSIYISITDDTKEKVQAKFGGEWESYGQGRTLVGIDTTQDEFNTINKTGGEKTHTLTINEMPSHSHQVLAGHGAGTQYFIRGNYFENVFERGSAYSITGGAGGDQPHNNLQPYITVYMYKRVS